MKLVRKTLFELFVFYLNGGFSFQFHTVFFYQPSSSEKIEYRNMHPDLKVIIKLKLLVNGEALRNRVKKGITGH